MGRCDVCGAYNWFGSRHKECVPKLVGGGLRKPEPISLPTDGTFEQSNKALSAVASAVSSGVSSVGVRLTRKGPHAERITRTIPELQAIVGCELRRGHIDDLWTGPQVTAKLFDHSTLANGEEAFIRWCRSEEAPTAVRAFAADRLGVLFWAAQELDASAASLLEALDGYIADSLPYFQLDALGCRIPSHAALDQFTSLRSDSIWELVWPPNDWLCRCKVFALMDMDVENKAEASMPGIKRIPTDVAVKCSDWYVRSPRNAIKLHPDRNK